MPTITIFVTEKEHTFQTDVNLASRFQVAVHLFSNRS